MSSVVMASRWPRGPVIPRHNTGSHCLCFDMINLHCLGHQDLNFMDLDEIGSGFQVQDPCIFERW